MTTQKPTTKEQIAAILGVEPKTITATNPDYSRLMREGITVAPHVSYWRGKTRLEWDHMGLWFESQEEKAGVEAVMNLGQLNLLPLEDLKKLGTIETKIRMLPKKHGVETLFGVFIPVTVYPAYKAEAEALKDEFFAVRDAIYSAWDEKMEEVELNLRKAARFAWRNKAGDPQGLKEVLTETRFVDKMSKAAFSLIPSQETVYKSFSLDFELRFIPLPDLLAEEVAAADIAKAEARAAWERVNLETQGAQERQRLLAEMNNDMISQSRARAQEIMDEFFLKLVSESRQLAYEVYQDVITSIKKNGKVHGRSIVSLRNLVTQVTKLATFYNGDRDLEMILKPARDILDALPETRLARIEDYSTQMEEVRKLTKNQLKNLGLSPRAGRGLDLSNPDVPLTQRGKRGLPSGDELGEIEVSKRGKRQGIDVTL